MTFCTHEGLRLHYREAGDPTADEGVVLLHSLGSDHRLWGVQQQTLADGQRVLAMDSRGHGRSEWPGALDAQCWVDDLAAVLDHAGPPRAHLVGLSMGGVQALAFAQRFPERVRSLVLADTFAALDEETATRKYDGMRLAASAQGMPGFAQQYIAETIKRDAADGRVEDLRAAMSAMPLEAFLASAHTCFFTDVSAELEGLAQPTLVLWGEHDEKTPRSLSEELASRIPNARLEIVPAAGHLSNLDNPDAFDQAVTRFLAAL